MAGYVYSFGSNHLKSENNDGHFGRNVWISNLQFSNGFCQSCSYTNSPKPLKTKYTKCCHLLSCPKVLHLFGIQMAFEYNSLEDLSSFHENQDVPFLNVQGGSEYRMTCHSQSGHNQSGLGVADIQIPTVICNVIDEYFYSGDCFGVALPFHSRPVHTLYTQKVRLFIQQPFKSCLASLGQEPSRDLNYNHLNTKLFEVPISNGLLFGPV